MNYIETSKCSEKKKGCRKTNWQNYVDIQNSKILLFANALGTTPGKLMGLTEFDSKEPTNIAAHFDGDDFTEEEMDDIRAYAEFVKNRRNKK